MCGILFILGVFCFWTPFVDVLPCAIIPVRVEQIRRVVSRKKYSRVEKNRKALEKPRKVVAILINYNRLF